MSKQKSAGMRANWIYCCHSNLQWHLEWQHNQFSIYSPLHKDSMKICKINSWLIKWFLKWYNVLILQNKIITLQIVSPRTPIVAISVSVYCLWCCSLSSYTKRNIVYFYLYYDNRIFLLCLVFLQFFCFVSLVLVNTHSINFLQ